MSLSNHQIAQVAVGTETTWVQLFSLTSSRTKEGYRISAMGSIVAAYMGNNEGDNPDPHHPAVPGDLALQKALANESDRFNLVTFRDQYFISTYNSCLFPLGYSFPYVLDPGRESMWGNSMCLTKDCCEECYCHECQRQPGISENNLSICTTNWVMTAIATPIIACVGGCSCISHTIRTLCPLQNEIFYHPNRSCAGIGKDCLIDCGNCTAMPFVQMNCATITGVCAYTVGAGKDLYYLCSPGKIKIASLAEIVGQEEKVSQHDKARKEADEEVGQHHLASAAQSKPQALSMQRERTADDVVTAITLPPPPIMLRAEPLELSQSRSTIDANPPIPGIVLIDASPSAVVSTGPRLFDNRGASHTAAPAIGAASVSERSPS